MNATANIPPNTAGSTNAPTLTELVSGILDDGQRLLKQQMDMVKAEFREDFRKTKEVIVYLGIGVGLAALGIVMLLVSLVHLVNYMTGWHMAGCWGLVGGATVALGIIAAVIGNRILASYNPLPDKSFNALQENVTWIANPQT